MACRNECPKECEFTLFKYTVTTGQFGYTIVAFRFMSFDFEELSEIPKMNFFTLISNIGGALGLFIGLQFLSFIEFIEFLIEVFFILFKK